jgi:hypothetical protein
MGCFSRDYITLAAEQGMPQDLICLPTMPPQEVITSEKGAGKDTQKKIIKIKSTEVMVKSQEKRMIR